MPYHPAGVVRTSAEGLHAGEAPEGEPLPLPSEEEGSARATSPLRRGLRRSPLDRLGGVDVARCRSPGPAQPGDDGVHRELACGATRGREGRSRRVELGPLHGDLAESRARGRRRRGHRLLLPPGLRRQRDEEGHRGRHRGPGDPARRFDHHAAAREEPVAVPLAQSVEESEGSDPHLAARAPPRQAEDPRDLPQRRGARARDLRRRRRITALLRQACRRCRRGRGCIDRGEPPRPASWHPGATSRGYLRHVERIRRRMERARLPEIERGVGDGKPRAVTPPAGA